MYRRNTYLPDSHGTNTKRTLQARHIPRDVQVGIILAVIAVIACAFICLLIWYLKRQSNIERRRAENKVDLLASESFDTSESMPNMEVGNSEDVYDGGRWDDKPLPRIPSVLSMRSYATAQNVGSDQPDPHSRTMSQISAQLSVSRAYDIRPPMPVLSRQRSMSTTFRSDVVSNRPSVTRSSMNFPLAIPHDSSITRSSTTRFHSRTNSAPSIGQVRSDNNTGSGVPVTSKTNASGTSRTQLTVINVTDVDAAGLQGPQMQHNDLPPNYTRGRDAPFPSKRVRKGRPPSIMTSLNENEMDGQFSVAPVFPREKQEFPDVPSTPTSYMVQVPISQAATGFPSLSQRVRSPLTITASYPVSKVTVEDMRSVRRTDGSRGKERMVTMSVLVDDSDSSSSVGDAAGDRPLSLQPPRRARSNDSRESQDILGEVVESYALPDLPPYTPAQEDFQVPEQ